ncbi:hypothetical protein [uncultured Campylobacter sp.]|uniref:hypothetical protein n=1 Tax=uncultured Campylobacter sp. TaxID=218934 RepID=UPI00262AAF14|nr:hypothetical protein [uncultured Campylobacter sp.]
MKNLFLLYACAEKFRAAKIDAINVSLSPKASMAEFHAAKREDAMKFLEFFCKRAERGLEILKFLSARHFGLRTAATEFLNLTPAPPRNGFRNLKFTSVPRNQFRILKFTRASERLTDIAQNFISQRGFKILKLICEPPHVLRPVLTRALRCALSRENKVEIEAGRGCSIAEKRRAVKLAHASGYLNSARRCIVRFCSAAARHGYKVGRAENFSRFDLTGALLNFISLPPRKFKPALLKFSPAPSRNGFRILKFTSKLRGGSEILNFTPKLRNRFEILKFTLAPRKCKPASAVRLNFALNSAQHAGASKFENGVKFKGATKFKRGTR